MFWEAFRVTSQGVLQIFILGLLGYFLVRKDILGAGCLGTLSRLTLEVALPAMIFTELLKNFSYQQYPNWWVFPLLSLLITTVGFAIGGGLGFFIDGKKKRLQCMNLVGFQNSGWLPLALVAALLPENQADVMFIYLFLFMAGFNLAIFSIGVFTLTTTGKDKFNPGSLVTMPVYAVLITLVAIAAGLKPFIPTVIIHPIELIGRCTVPLALLVVGGNLAQIRLAQTDKKAVALVLLGKLLILPLVGLLAALKLNLPYLIGLLIVMETAVPSATTLSVIIRSYDQEDLLVSHSIFFGHILALVSLPVFLSLYFSLVVIK